MSRGESKTRCSASVSSTTPRLEPRCPPFTDTAWTMNSRISRARVVSSGSPRRRRSAGEEIVSRIMRYRTLPLVAAAARTPTSAVPVACEVGQRGQRVPALGHELGALEGGHRLFHELVDLA